MKRSNKYNIFATLIALLACSCSHHVNECANFSSEYKKSTIDVSSLNKINIELSNIKKAVAAIKKCYPNHRYMGFDNRLEILDVRAYRSGYLVIGELYGVEDVKLIFETNKDGIVIKSYQSTT